MNINKDFATYMDNNGFGTFGTDLFIAGAPLEAPSTCWWVVSGGGVSEPRNTTGERQNRYLIDVFYRNIDTETVYEQLQAFADLVNGAGCVELDNYTFLDMEAITFPTDQDIDDEERTIGLIQVALAVYQTYE